MHEIETDYLIVGAGCVGLSFADVLVAETDADVVIVDSRARPGGHWNDAYPFVTLHQPSSFYGVSSIPLGTDRIDVSGPNAGMGELATGTEVLDHFDRCLRRQLLPTGRVRWFPCSDFDGMEAFTSRVTGETHRVTVRKRIVDTTQIRSTIPATHTPGFAIDEGVRFVPVNGLPHVNEKPAGYVIVGGGKTGIDAVLWLLGMGVDPDTVTWIMPRDAWFIPRETTQPRLEAFEAVIGAQAAQYEAAAEATSIDDLFHRLEAAGVLMRLDPDVEPRMFHAATMSRAELAELRRVRNVVRLGRVTHLGRDVITLRDGTIPTSPEHLHVDCSASAIPFEVPEVIFDGERITPMTVRAYQPAFSAAVIAWVEAHHDDDAVKNALCGIVPIPNDRTDWLRLTIANAINMQRWSQDAELSAFLAKNRLNGFAGLVGAIAPDDAPKMALLARLRAAMEPGCTNLFGLLAEAQG